MGLDHRPIALLRAAKAFIVVDRSTFHLYHYAKRKSGAYYPTRFRVAVGKRGDATPRGLYYVDAKTRKPAWQIPEHEDYPRESWGRIVPFKNPDNPFAGGFLSLSGGDGVGIHGTKFNPQLGTRASHGCIRVNTEDLKWLYKRTPLGSLVKII